MRFIIAGFRFSLIVVIFLAFSLNIHAQSVAGQDPVKKQNGGEPGFQKDRIIVKYKKNAMTEDTGMVATVADGSAVAAKHFHGRKGSKLDGIHKKHGIKTMRRAFGKDKGVNKHKISAAQAEKLNAMKQDVYVLETDGTTSVEAAVQELSKDPDVEYAQPDYIMTANSIPNDPYFSSMGSWGQSYDDLWGIKKMNVPVVWDKT
ncbi:MAG: hypothetical protein WCI27_00330, partial [Candidatus Omnitrophota bacterium]